MASLLSGLGSAATGIGAGIGSAASSAWQGIGSAARAGNNLLAADVGGMTTPDVLPAGVQGPVRPGVGATGINWADILKAAQSGGNTQGMMPLAVNKAMLNQNNANKRTDLQEAIMIASAFVGGA